MAYDSGGVFGEPYGAPVGGSGNQAQQPAYAQGVSGNARDGSIKTYGGESGGRVQNDSAWGGWSGQFKQGPDGRWYSDQSQSGRQQDVDRYRGMGQNAAQRQAYQVDYAKANQDRELALQARGMQGDATGMYRDTAMGGDTAALRLQRDMLARAQQMQYGAALSGGGDALSHAGAFRSAQNHQGAMTMQGNQLIEAQRADQMAKAREGWLNEATAQRQGDMTGMGLSAQQAETQAQSEMGQRDLNDQAQLGYEGLGFDTNSASQQGVLHGMGVDTTNMGTGMGAAAADTARGNRYVGAGVQAVGTMFTSDTRAKRGMSSLAYGRRGY